MFKSATSCGSGRRVLYLFLFLCLLPGGVSGAGDSSTSARDKLIRALSLKRQVGQLFMVSFPGTLPSEKARKLLSEWAPGGVVLYRHNTSTPKGVAQLSSAIQKLVRSGSGPGALLAVDMEGGGINRFLAGRGFSAFPPAALVAATDDPKGAAALGRAMALELRALGIRMNLAPVADVADWRTSSLIRDRSFGSDPHGVGRMVAAFVRGSQDAGVLTCAKHFPGHGGSRSDSHKVLPVVKRTREVLEKNDLVPFRMAIEAGVGSIMAAHIWYPDLDPAANSPASLSAPVLAGLLRGDLGFRGLILTDALDMTAVKSEQGYGVQALKAIEAGSDLIMFGSSVSLAEQRQAMEHVLNAAIAGQISPDRLRASLARIISAKASLGLLTGDGKSAADEPGLRDQSELLGNLSARAITIVRDRSAAVPLQAGQSVLMIYPKTAAPLAQGCREQAPQLHLLELDEFSEARIPEEVQLKAQAADVVVLLTRNALAQPEQTRFIRALPQDKLVLIALGSPFHLRAAREAAGLIAVYEDNPHTQQELCDVLLGRKQARGVMPFDLGLD